MDPLINTSNSLKRAGENDLSNLNKSNLKIKATQSRIKEPFYLDMEKSNSTIGTRANSNPTVKKKDIPDYVLSFPIHLRRSDH